MESAAGTYSGEMLLLVDLDNTLVDRASAFNLWASDFVQSLGRADSETAWLIGTDRDGYEPRESLARAIEERFETGLGIEALLEMPLYDHVGLMTMDTVTTRALRNARESGWTIGVVTNGSTAQQTLKIHTVGLEPYVDTVIISEAEGVKKPDAEIFEIAARRLGAGVAGGGLDGRGSPNCGHLGRQGSRPKDGLGVPWQGLADRYCSPRPHGRHSRRGYRRRRSVGHAEGLSPIPFVP